MSYPPQNAPPLEGEYSAWTIYDSFDDNVDLSINDMVFRADETNQKQTLILWEMANHWYKFYTVASKTLSAKTNIDFEGAKFVSFNSVMSKYAVAMTGTAGNLLILKNGAVIQTTTMANLGLTYISGVSITQSGKYVAVIGTRTASGVKGWVLLVGA